MKILVLPLLAIVVSTGWALIIEVTTTPGQISEGTSVRIGCLEEVTDADRVGELTHLSVETLTHQEVFTEEQQYPGSQYWQRVRLDKLVMAPVVSLAVTGGVVWGEGYTDSRLSLTGSLQPNSSSLTLLINGTRCTDGPSFVCVARGPRGTMDSARQGLSVFAIPNEVRITGGRNCPLSLHQSRDHCDLYARAGDRLDLICNARSGQPLYANTVTWSGQSGLKWEDIKDTKTMMANSTSDTCSGEITSSLGYTFNPTEENGDDTIQCSVLFTRPLGEFSSSRKVTICSEIPVAEAAMASYTRDHIIGIFFAGFATMLVILVLVLLVMCCCGCRLGVKRRHKLDVTESYPEKF